MSYLELGTVKQQALRLPDAERPMCRAIVARGRPDRGPEHPCPWQARYLVRGVALFTPGADRVCGVHGRMWQRRVLIPLGGLVS